MFATSDLFVFFLHILDIISHRLAFPTRRSSDLGGLAFLIGGHMAVAASGQGGLLVRVDAAQGERLITSGSAQPMEMRGRAIDRKSTRLNSSHLVISYDVFF